MLWNNLPVFVKKLNTDFSCLLYEIMCFPDHSAYMQLLSSECKLWDQSGLIADPELDRTQKMCKYMITGLKWLIKGTPLLWWFISGPCFSFPTFFLKKKKKSFKTFHLFTVIFYCKDSHILLPLVRLIRVLGHQSREKHQQFLLLETTIYTLENYSVNKKQIVVFTA